MLLLYCCPAIEVGAESGPSSGVAQRKRLCSSAEVLLAAVGLRGGKLLLPEGVRQACLRSFTMRDACRSTREQTAVKLAQAAYKRAAQAEAENMTLRKRLAEKDGSTAE